MAPASLSQHSLYPKNTFNSVYSCVNMFDSLNWLGHHHLLHHPFDHRKWSVALCKWRWQVISLAAFKSPELQRWIGFLGCPGKSQPEMILGSAPQHFPNPILWLKPKPSLTLHQMLNIASLPCPRRFHLTSGPASGGVSDAPTSAGVGLTPPSLPVASLLTLPPYTVAAWRSHDLQ